MIVAMGEWWALWGQTILWVLGALAATIVSLFKFQRQLDKQFASIDRRLYRIELGLGIQRERRLKDRTPGDDSGAA